ncbi:MAG: hypothetical protein M9922_15010 [Microthrixaceae bacterium]|nr:hypothetical protein [Microthrixaceae bacterium]
MRNVHDLRPIRRTLGVALALPLLAGALLIGCSSDDEAATTTEATTTEATTSAPSTTGDATFPSEEFCEAQADLAAAQDGAQRNTAIADMQAELGDAAPAAVSDALDTLLTGDLAPTAYSAAEEALAGVCS